VEKSPDRYNQIMETRIGNLDMKLLMILFFIAKAVKRYNKSIFWENLFKLGLKNFSFTFLKKLYVVSRSKH
jgi:hypothetical protein